MRQDTNTLTPEQRRDVRTALIFFGLGGTSFLGFVIATTRWRPESWTALGAVGACVQALGVLAALIFGFGQLREMRQLRLEQVRPFVVVDFDASRRPWFYLTVTNLGSVVARNVQLVFDPPLRTSGDAQYSIENVRFLYDPIPTLVPSKRLETFFDSAITRKPEEYEDRYEATVTYESDDGRTFSDAYVLDLAGYRGASYIDGKDLGDMHRALEVIGDHLKQMRSPAGGLKVMTPADIAADLDARRAEMKRRRIELEGAEDSDA